MVMLKDQWIDLLSLQIDGGINTNDNVVANTVKLVDLKNKINKKNNQVSLWKIKGNLKKYPRKKTTGVGDQVKLFKNI